MTEIERIKEDISYFSKRKNGETINNKEAAEVLRRLKISGLRSGKTLLNDAIKKAIETLESEPCEDAVSRAAALKALAELPHEYKTKEQRARTGGIAACQVIVGELPRVTPKPKTGKWIQHGIGFRCSECAIQTSEHNVKSGLMKYCPNCGAKMEGENE